MDPITVVDMHTGGEPLRIVTGGYPRIEGRTILEKRAYARDHLDHLRRLLIFEPRGHFDMYGAILVEPTLPEADLAVLFMHNEGYSTMCGHAIIALGRYAVDHEIVASDEPHTTVRIEAPCGLIVANVEVSAGKSGAVSFESVPSFLLERDVEIDLPGYGRIQFDIAYGGAFYALVPAASFGLVIGRDRVRHLADAADRLTKAVQATIAVTHPQEPDLGFLYGTILTDGGDGSNGVASRNVCVFAEAEVDRSPTGSGVTARMAAMHARGEVRAGETRLFESVTGSRFAGQIATTCRAGGQEAVTVRVSGRAFYSGRAEFTLEGDDELGRGFLLR